MGVGRNRNGGQDHLLPLVERAQEIVHILSSRLVLSAECAFILRGV